MRWESNKCRAGGLTGEDPRVWDDVRPWAVGANGGRPVDEDIALVEQLRQLVIAEFGLRSLARLCTWPQ